VWFHACAAWLKIFWLSGCPAVSAMTRSSGIDSKRVPATSSFSFFTYAAWCLP
jgi:hypothetical protein